MRILKVVSTSDAKNVVFQNVLGQVRARSFKPSATDSDIEKTLRAEDEKISPPAGDSPAVSSMAGSKQRSVAVAVTCHGPYLKLLEKQIKAIDNQTIKADEKFLVLDGCEPPEWLPEDWKVLKHDSGTPNPGRNLATKATKCEWMVYADADDEMHKSYIAGISRIRADDGVGIIYGDLFYGGKRRMSSPSVFDYWRLRAQNYVSACSAWRVRAILEAGGWPNTECYDDHSLALMMTSLGWGGAKNPYPIQINSHNEAPRRHDGAREGKDFKSKWECRSFGIVSLLAGRRECLPKWRKWILEAELPKNVTVHVLDNSGDADFGKEVLAAMVEFSTKRGFGIDYHAYGEPCDINKTKWERHRHVAKLYNHIVPLVREDWFVSLEDDVVPPLDGLRKLVSHYSHRHWHGAISGIYQSRSRKVCVVGAKAVDYWRDMFTWDEVKDPKLYKAGFVAGGFTLWSNGLVQKSLPFRFSMLNGTIPCGWDTNISKFVRAAGFNLYLDGSVVCDHDLLTGGGVSETHNKGAE